MKRVLLMVPVLVLVSAVLLAAGCGGGGSSSRNTAYSNSKSAFAAAMNSVCASLNAQVRTIGRPQTLAEVASKGPELQSQSQKALSKLESLEPPAEIKAAFDDFIATSKQQDTLIGQLIDAAKAKDGAKVKTLGAQIDELSKKSDADVQQIGAPACLSSAT
jgi:hypothetical protein